MKAEVPPKMPRHPENVDGPHPREAFGWTKPDTYLPTANRKALAWAIPPSTKKSARA